MAGVSSGDNRRECDGEAGGKRKRKAGLLYDERMCKHDTPDGEDHPECPDRIRVIWEKLQVTGLAQKCVVLGGSNAEDKHLQLVHTKDHVKMVRRISKKQKDSRRNKIASQLNNLNSIYLNAAYLAAGSVVQVAEKVAEGELDCGFAIVRPPGHHAEADEPMGFCLFNNPDLGIKRILIVDWGVHHGNGTQKMFWKDPRVLVFSVHRHDFGSFYPTGDDGYYNMIGEGPGKGFNINVPWEQGECGDADYLAAWDDILIPVTKEFNPNIILVSAGFDAAIGDPLGRCCVTPYGYSVMLNKLMEFAQGKIVMALEGGYNLDSIAKSSVACVKVLLEDKPIQGSSEEYPLESTWHVIQAVRKELCAYWPSLADELSWKLIDQETPTPMAETEDYAHGLLRYARPYVDFMIPDDMFLPIDTIGDREAREIYQKIISKTRLFWESTKGRVNSYVRKLKQERRRDKVQRDELKAANATISELTKEVTGLRSKVKDVEIAKAKASQLVSALLLERDRAVAAKEEKMKTRYDALTAAHDKAKRELASKYHKRLAKVEKYHEEDKNKHKAALAALQVLETELDGDL